MNAVNVPDTDLAVNTVAAIREKLGNTVLDSRVKRLVLFGSQAKGTADAASDIDLYLDSDQQLTGLSFFSVKGQLEDIFHCTVDLIPDVDVIPESTVDLEIRKTGVTVYGS